VLVTAAIGWYVVAVLPRRRASWSAHDRLLVVSVVLIVANGVLVSAYIKDEILSVGGVFYAVAAYVAIRALIESAGTGSRRRLAIVALLLVVSGPLWAWRAAGVHYHLRNAAFKTKSEWVMALPPGAADRWPGERRARAVLHRLYSEAIARPVIDRQFLPHWGDDLWGE
jgi:hypothetical protein